MNDHLERLETRVDSLLQKHDTLRRKNEELTHENESLKSELLILRRDLDALRLQQNDRATAVKEKLSLVLNRIEELEGLGL